MDRISVIGLLVGLVAVLAGHWLEGGSLETLLQPAAFAIVVGGTLGALLLQSSWPLFRRAVRQLRWVFTYEPPDFNRAISQINSWCQLARRESILALEDSVPVIKDPFLRNGLQRVVDAVEPMRLRETMDMEITHWETELRQAARVWESAAGYSPTVGILGAVMGLIHVMENLTDPARLGQGIATAFVSTVYGVGLANLVYLPLANKLKLRIGQMVSYREMLVDGLVGIANGDNPRLLEAKLKTYLPSPD